MARDDESLITNLDQDFSVPIPFTSTTGNIGDVRYNPATETLFITFDGHGRGGGTYAYFDVDVRTATGFFGASSATQYFNLMIRDRFEEEWIG
jgi:hypothetical protein